MADYVCPKEICRMFEGSDDTRKQLGREMASRWASSLLLLPGDLVWLPELGWCARTDDEAPPRRVTFH